MIKANGTFYDYLNEAYKDPTLASENLKKYLTEEVIGEERIKLLIEIKCFEFFFQNGTLKPMMEFIDKQGNNACYPDTSAFTEEEINYLKARVKQVTQPFLLSRYSHLLWLIKKHKSFAEVCVDAYLKLTLIFFELSINGNNLYYKFCSTLHCFHNISVTIKYKLNDCKNELLKWIGNEQLPATWKDNIIDIIVDSPLFKQKDLQGLTELMLSFIPAADQKYFDKERYLKSCLLLSQKEGVANNEIFNLLGENELLLAGEKEDDNSGMIAMSSYQKASYYFRMAGNDIRYNEASALYTQQKSKFRLNLFEHEFESEKVKLVNEGQNKMVDKMLSEKEFASCWYLVHNKNLLMNDSDITKAANESIKASSFMNLVNTQVYDLNNNARALISQHDKLEYQKFQNYIFHLQLTTISIIQKFLYKGIRTGKLSGENIMTFFKQTWLGNKLKSFSSDSEPEIFSWMQLLGPALHDLLFQIEAQILDKNFQPNFLLCIDSLSIKIEGVIRDIARLSGKSVTRIKETEALEMNLEELLKDESICKIFTEEDVLLWKYLLTKKGWNIRNNVAHSFYRPADYNDAKATLLLLAVFRLCKYEPIS
jgi:hypothetical protein